MAKIHERLAGGRPGLWEPRLTPLMVTQVASPGEPRWSPDGRSISYLHSRNGEGRLVVVPAEGGPDVQITTDPPAQPGGSYAGGFYDWSPDGQSLVYLARDGKLWIVPARGGQSRRLAVGEGRQRAPAWSPDGRSIAYAAEAEEQSTIAVADVSAAGVAWPRRIGGDADFAQDAAWSHDSRRLAWNEWNVPNMPWDGSRIVLADLATGERRVVAGGDDVATSQPRFSPDGRSLAFLCDRDGWLNLWIANADGSGARPLIAEEFEHGPPTWSPGARTYAWSPDGKQIAYLRNDDGHWRARVADVATGATRSVDESDGMRASIAWSARNELVVVHSAADSPPSVRTIDLASGSIRAVSLAGAAGLTEGGAVTPEPMRWTARDGATLYGHVYRPRQESKYPTPLLVMLHGGPTSQFGVGWNGQIQYFVQRGWTVFTPEYRGSTGYGRAYAQALRENWGIYDVNDTADGIDHLVATGTIDRDRVVVMGGSAGGYTVLMLLALAGDRIRAGVDLFGVADLWELNEGTHRFEAHYNHQLVGSLPEAATRYDERSPVNLADRIKAPVLVLQGDVDPVVPKVQSDELVERIRRAGGTVEYQVYAGEGHGWARIDTQRDAIERTDRFLASHVLLR